MRIMKRVGLLLVALCLTVTVAFARGGREKQPGVARCNIAAERRVVRGWNRFQLGRGDTHLQRQDVSGLGQRNVDRQNWDH